MNQIHLKICAVDEKHVRISAIPPLLAYALRELPHILEKRDSPEVHARLFPAPTEKDLQMNADWKEFTTPELRHLFISAGETVAQDLAGMEPEAEGANLWHIEFLANHVDAWMSAVNQARLILGELHSVTDSDMERKDLDFNNPKDRAILIIHALAWLLEELIRFGDGEDSLPSA